MKVKNVQIVTEMILSTDRGQVEYRVGDEMIIEVGGKVCVGKIRRITYSALEIEIEGKQVVVKYGDIEQVF